MGTHSTASGLAEHFRVSGNRFQSEVPGLATSVSLIRNAHSQA